MYYIYIYIRILYIYIYYTYSASCDATSQLTSARCSVDFPFQSMTFALSSMAALMVFTSGLTRLAPASKSSVPGTSPLAPTACWRVAEKKGNRGKPRGKSSEHQLNILEYPERVWTSCVPKVEKQSCLQGNEGHVVFAFVAHHHHLSDGGSTWLHMSETLLKSREAGGFLNWGYLYRWMVKIPIENGWYWMITHDGSMVLVY